MPVPVLGRKVTRPVDTLDVFPAPPDVTRVEFSTEEPVPSMCPATGQPDQTDVVISYVPRDVCIESKSLKLYLWGFRDEGHFVEEMSRIILERVWRDTYPLSVVVTCHQWTRGGIRTRAVAERHAQDFMKGEAS